MKCSTCNGTGKIALFTSVSPCENCGGTGDLVKKLLSDFVESHRKDYRKDPAVAVGLTTDAGPELDGILDRTIGKSGSCGEKYLQQFNSMQGMSRDELQAIANSKDESVIRKTAAKSWLTGVNDPFSEEFAKQVIDGAGGVGSVLRQIKNEQERRSELPEPDLSKLTAKQVETLKHLFALCMKDSPFADEKKNPAV